MFAAENRSFVTAINLTTEQTMDISFEKRLLRPYNGPSSSPVVRNLFGPNSGVSGNPGTSRSPVRSSLFATNSPKSQNMFPGLASNRTVSYCKLGFASLFTI